MIAPLALRSSPRSPSVASATARRVNRQRRGCRRERLREGRGIDGAPGRAAKPLPVRQSRIRALARYDMPNVLTDRWLAAWGKVTRVSPAFFATSYGPLRGYSYGVEEFVALLRDVELQGDENIILEFDLHDYYQSEPRGEVLVHTFGLLLWTAAGKTDDGTEGVNMGTPCPPVC